MLFNILEHTHVVFHPDSGYLWSFLHFLIRMSYTPEKIEDVVHTLVFLLCCLLQCFRICLSYSLKTVIYYRRSTLFFLSVSVLRLPHFRKQYFDHNRTYCLSGLSMIEFVDFVQNVFKFPCEIFSL